MEQNRFPAKEIIELMRNCKVYESFTEIVKHLHYSNEAQALFCQLLRSRLNVFLLEPYKDQIRSNAEAGNPWMQYAWARYNECLMPEEDSIDTAEEYYLNAQEAGIADARMCLAYMWRDGDFGIVDRERYCKERDLAATQNSHMAMQQILRDMTYGNGGFEANPRDARDTLCRFLLQSESFYIDPRYYTLMGDICEEVAEQEHIADCQTNDSMDNYEERFPMECCGKECSMDNCEKECSDWAEAEDEAEDDVAIWYEKGLDEGDLEACFLLAVRQCFDEQFYIKDAEKFVSIMLRGQEMMCADAFMLLLMMIDEEQYAEYDDELKRQTTEGIIEDLMISCRLGNSTAAYALGDNWRNGSFGFEQDYQKASIWFSKGALQRNPLCYKMLAEMIREGTDPEGRSEETMHFYELQALRLGDTEMLETVVDSYEHGHLTDFAAEIEKYYIPELARQRQEKYDDWDDDGRFDAWS